MNKLSFKSSFILLTAAVLVVSGFLVSAGTASATADPQAVLSVTSITQVANSGGSVGYASADNLYADGWQWVFNVTVPTNETVLNMKFDDWTSGSNTISALDNIKFYSPQSSNANNEASAIGAANAYSGEMDLIPTEYSANGRQIQIFVEARVPTGKAGGSYSTSFGIQTNPDKTAPVITITGANPQTIEGGTAYTELGATALDNVDRVVVVTPDASDVNINKVGPYTVTYTATDSSDNTATATRTVNVVDTTAPTITGTPEGTTVEATSPAGAVVEYTNPTATDIVDGTDAVTCLPASGSTFALGATTVNCNSKDTAGNSATQTSFTVTVQDTTPPTISGTPGEDGITVEATSPEGALATWDAPTATDIVDGTTDAVTCLPASGSTFKLGTTVVTCTSTDVAKNTATSTFNVTVRDTTKPVITITGDNPQTLEGGSVYTDSGATATDLADGTDAVITDASAVKADTVGSYAVTYTATDAAGNTATATRTVNVVDTTKPTITSPENITKEATGATTSVDLGTPTVSDNVSASPVVTNDAPDGFPVGTTTVTWTATDASGNSATATQTVTITDATAPVVTVPVDMTLEAISADGAVATYTATASDLVDGSTEVTCLPASGSTFAIKTTTVTCTSTDNHTNTGTASFTVTVQDTTKPVITLNGVTPDILVGGTYAELGATATDAVDGTFAATPSGSVDTTTANSYTITYNATDKAGNSATPVTRIVNVVKADQTITVTTLAPESAIYNSTFPVVATASSGLDVDITTTGGCSIADGTVTMTSGTTDCVVNYNQAGNGGYNPAPEITENVTAQQKTITATVTADNKTYDGTPTATINDCSLSVLVGSDTVTCSAADANFPDKNVGTSRIVTANGITLGGADDANYTLSSGTAITTADITAKLLTVSATAGSSKVYDGTTAADQVNLTTNASSGDSVTATGISYYLDTENIGTNKPVTVKGISISGTDAGNYTLSNKTATTTADITPLGLTGNITTDSKPYDGSTSATIATRTLSGVLSGDSVSYVGGTATFNTKDVGTGKTVTGTGLSLSGADAGNYTVNDTAITTADITPATTPITVTATAIDKIYDGTTTATATLTPTGALGSDIVTASGTANFSNKNVGDEKTVNITGITLGGADAGNYTLSNTTASATASITALPITVTAATDSKVYDTTTSSVGVPTISPALVGGDTASFTQTFDTATVGTEKTLTPAGTVNDGNGGANYTVTVATDTTGVINQATPTVTWATPADITYGTSLSGTQLDATLSVPGTPVYAPSSEAVLDAGAGQTLSVTFTPTDTINYTTATKTVLINVNNQDQSAPTGLTGVVPTSLLNDGQITGTTIAMEYKLVTDTNYTAVIGTTISGLVSGDYDVRYAAKTNYNASLDTSVTVPAYVAPVISLTGLPTTTVTTEGAATEDKNGIVTGFTVGSRTPIQVTLTKGSANYSNVRILVTGLNSGVQLLATDGTHWYDIVNTGWGPASGFPIATATTPVYLVANTAGTYTATIELVDVSNGNAVLATTTASVTAAASQLAPTGLVGVVPTSLLNDGQITGTTTAMEYKLATDTNYTTVAGTTISGLVSGDYDVRYATKPGYLASPDTTVTVPAYVAPVISFSGVPTTVTTETAIPETPENSGVIGSSFTPTGTLIQATLTKGSANYSKVRVVVTGLNSGVQLIAEDTTGIWYNIAETGWGPVAGFNLATVTTPVYLVANTPGTYTATINLVDVSNANAVLLATTTASVTANAPAPVLSSDDTLSGLTADVGTLSPVFAAGTLSYTDTLPADTTTVPTITATANDTNATAFVTPAGDLTGSTTVLVTAQDGTKQTYTVIFTVTP